jgi:Gpi18-like mannosyltransferase
MISNIFNRNRNLICTLSAVVIIKIILFVWGYFNANFVINSWINIFGIWDHWDSDVYKTIATSSYALLDGMRMDAHAFLSHFPPLYSLFVFLLTVIKVPILISGFLVSFSSIILASIILYKLVLLDFKSEKIAIISVLFLNLFPTSYFTISIYSESLFLLFAICSFYFLRKNNFLFSGFFAGAAILTRNVGLVFIPVYSVFIIVDYWKTKQFNYRTLYLLIMPACGVMIYMLINLQYFGDYFYFMNEQLSFNTTKHLMFPFRETVSDFIAIFKDSNYLSQTFMTNRGYNAIFVLFASLVTIFGARKIKWEYTLFSILSILMFASLSWGISNARYVFSVFPIYIVLSLIENKWIRICLFSIFIIGLAYFSKLFAGGDWAF